MADSARRNVSPPLSPVSQLLQGLGMTREDLVRKSDQMREFLTSERANSFRAFMQDREEVQPPSTPKTSERSSRSVSRSFSTNDASGYTSPPATPIKTEPVDPPTSLRKYDSMEAVIERQNSRKSKKGRKHHHSRSRDYDDSPERSRSPSSSSRRRHSFVEPGSSRRVPDSDESHSTRRNSAKDAPPPVTPSAGRYYRDSVLYQSSSSRPARQNTYVPRPESPSPSKSRSSVASSSYAKERQVFPPITPRRPYYREELASPSMSTPDSSPIRKVNIVSSPGPMGSGEEEFSGYPFTLPPGPYSPHKPDLPYAAIIGQAILSSTQHRLTLQEIYSWITIVYPYFKRNEQTWMNSIRHVLSTTVVFRKVQRDRAVGRTLWAIWDADLPCFENGGFNKEASAEMVEQKAKKEANKKRPAEDIEAPRNGKTKRSKKATQPAADPTPAAEEESETAKSEPPVTLAELGLLPHQHSYPMPPPPPHMGVPLSSVALYSGPIFPAPRPGTHQQPYYPSTSYPMPQPGMALPDPYSYPPHPHMLPAGVIFPPLPPGAAIHQATAEKEEQDELPTDDATSISRPGTSSSYYSTDADYLPSSSPPQAPPVSDGEEMSMPDLTNCSSSSPPDDDEEPTGSGEEDGAAVIDGSPDLDMTDYIVDDPYSPARDISPVASKVVPKGRRGKDAESPEDAHAHARAPKLPQLRPVTPPPPTNNIFPSLKSRSHQLAEPSTPPRKSAARPASRGSAGHMISAVRTPLSHLGVHMSPSPSLAYYKSNLNPPPNKSPLGSSDSDTLPTVSAPGASSSTSALPYPPTDMTSTPSRGSGLRRTSSTFSNPFTPRNLSYPSFGSGSNSPFRSTPSNGVYDPHDPSAMLNDELARMGERGSIDSPSGYSFAGMFGKTKGLMYESPDGPSPKGWSRAW